MSEYNSKHAQRTIVPILIGIKPLKKNYVRKKNVFKNHLKGNSCMRPAPERGVWSGRAGWTCSPGLTEEKEHFEVDNWSVRPPGLNTGFLEDKLNLL